MTAGDFGGLVRRRRERLGLSQGRVAELIGRSPSTVRAWEKGRQVPVDPVVISLLAAVLDVDEADLLRTAGVEPPSQEQTLTIEEALSSIAPNGSPGGATPAADAAGPAPPSTDDAAEAEAPDRQSAAPDREAPVSTDRAAADVEAPPDIPDAEPSPSPPAEPPISREAPSPPATQEQQEQEPPPDPPPRPVWEGRDDGRRQAPSAGPVARTMPPPAPEPNGSYLEDPEQRMAYRLRTIYTLVALAAVFIVAIWALGNAFEALGEVWDELTGML